MHCAPRPVRRPAVAAPVTRLLLVLLFAALASLGTVRTTHAQGLPPGGLALPPMPRSPAPGADTTPGAGIRVYLMTMGPGDAVWEKFGHNALWIRDPSRGIDLAYNWGLFDFNEADFIPRFLKGSMRYWMEGIPAEPMIAFYARSDRSVWAQELELTPAQKLELVRFVELNALEENRFYHYDYFLDNCSTRVRDALDRALGGRIRATTDTIATGTSYRWHTRRLTQEELPIYTGMDLVLGQPGDREISAWAEMFLPMRMRDHLASVTVPGPDGVARPLVRSEVQLYAARRSPEATAPANLVLAYLALGTALAAVIAALGMAADRGGRGARVGLAVIGTMWGLVSGILGTIMVLTWAATDHSFMYRNENLLQFTPLSLLLAFLLPRLFL
ncbi:MAG: lipoprotein N-acyltransferase Lnb domain-containing protein, partial [Gemmatimonadaceae bacterium]